MGHSGMFAKAVMAGFLVGLGTVGWPSDAAPQASTSWRFYLYTPAPHPATRTLMQFAEEVKSRSGGRLEIKVFPAGELPYRPSQGASMIANRFVELSDSTGTFIEGEVPIAPLIELPYLIETIEQHRKATEVFVPFMNAAVERFDAEVLFWYGYPTKKLLGRGKPPQAFADLKGRKFRSLGRLDGEVLRTLGMTPVTMPPGDVAVALSRGVIDGFLASWFFSVATKWFEQAQWSYNANLGAISSYVLVNRQALRALPSDVQKVLRELGVKYSQVLTSQIIPLEEKSGETVRKAGVTFVPPTPEDTHALRSELLPFGDRWASQVGREAQEALAKVRTALP